MSDINKLALLVCQAMAFAVLVTLIVVTLVNPPAPIVKDMPICVATAAVMGILAIMNFVERCR